MFQLFQTLFIYKLCIYTLYLTCNAVIVLENPENIFYKCLYGCLENISHGHCRTTNWTTAACWKRYDPINALIIFNTWKIRSYSYLLIPLKSTIRESLICIFFLGIYTIFPVLTCLVCMLAIISTYTYILGFACAWIFVFTY